MIKLTLNPKSSPQELRFIQNTILIGCGDVKAFDLNLAQAPLSGPLLSIFEREGMFHAVALAEELKPTLNGTPFTSTILGKGDIIAIGDNEIRFDEGISEPAQQPSPLPPGTEELLEEVDILTGGAPAEKPPSKVILPKEFEDEMEALFAEVKQPSPQKNAPAGQSKPPADEQPQEKDAIPSEEASESDKSVEELLSGIFKAPAAEKKEDEALDIDELIAAAESADLDKIVEEMEIRADQKQAKHEMEIYGVAFGDERDDMDETYAVRKKIGLIEAALPPPPAEEAVEAKALEEEAAAKAVAIPIVEEAKKEEIDILAFGGVDFDTDYTQEAAIEEEKEPVGPSPTAIIVRFVAIATGSVFLLSIAAFTSLFLYFQFHNPKIELRAAQGLTDLAVALLDVKKNSAPDKSIVIDQVVLGEALDNLLPPEYRSLSQIDSVGKYIFPDYEIEIFGTASYDRFLILSTPVPSFWDELFPKKMFIIDSETLSLHSTTNIVTWLELLREGTSLESIRAKKIRELLDETQIVSLKSLDAAASFQAFSPPESILEDFPGAKNYIYNAPRYHRFGEKLLENATGYLTSRPKLSAIDLLYKRHEVQLDAEKYDKFENLVHYHSHGKDAALEATYALKVTLPSERFLIGYIELAPETRMISEAKILTDEDFDLYLIANNLPQPSTIIPKKEWEAYAKLMEQLKSAVEQEKVMPSEEIAEESPDHKRIRTQVQTLAKNRQTDLKQIEEELKALEAQNQASPISDYESKHKELLDKYQDLHDVHQKLIDNSLSLLYTEYAANNAQDNLPFLYDVVESSGLLAGLSKDIRDKLTSNAVLQKSGVHRKLIQELGTVSNLELLDKTLTELGEYLNPSVIANPVELNTYKQMIRYETLKKLNQLLVAPEMAVKSPEIQISNERLIGAILRKAFISEQDERDFYLREFDLLMQKMRQSANPSDIRQLTELHEKLIVLTETDSTLSETMKQQLQEKYLLAIEQLEESREKIFRDKANITNIPLEALYTTDPERKNLYFGRLGQQLLVQASQAEPSSLRDAQLYEAIYLLKQGTDDNRMLWGDVLEARKLLTQTPQKKMEEALGSNIGFRQQVQPRYAELRQLLFAYIEGKKSLSEINNKERYDVQFEIFKKEHLEGLQKMLTMAKEISAANHQLFTGFQEYLQAQENFLEDYEKAKNDGFFVVSSDYQTLMLSRLKRRLMLSKSLLPAIENLTQHFITAAEQYQSLIESEITSLQDKTPVTSEAIQLLVKTWNTLSFPDPHAHGIIASMDDIFAIRVDPKR